MPPNLIFNAIVKNEAVNILRCLSSVEPHVIGFAITDTGSTDNTVALMQKFCDDHKKPLWLNRAEFINFSQARNAALRHARGLEVECWGYLLGDADMELIVETEVWPKLTAKSYALMQTNGLLRYYNVRLLHRTETVEYVGKTHECLTPVEPPVAIQGGIWYRDHETGSNRADKYIRDIRLLKEEILADPMNPRSIFYMVQSLVGAGMIERAREMCDFRVRMGGHPEEIYWCLFQAAQLDAQLKRDDALIEHEYIQAYQFRPTRAEPLHHLAKHHAKLNQNRAALLYASVAASMPMPDEVLPVEVAVYDWMALDTLLIVAAACGDKIWARWAARTLRKRKVPEAERQRINGNIDATIGKKT